MTTSTDQTAIPAPPAWLNLDAVIPVELRTEIAEVSAALQAFLDEGRFEAVCRRASEITCKYDAAIAACADAIDDDVLHRASGYDAMWHIGGRLASMAQVAIGDRPSYIRPDWYRRPHGVVPVPPPTAEWVEEHGDKLTEYLLLLGRPHEWPVDQLQAWADRADREALDRAVLRINEWSWNGVPPGWHESAGGIWKIEVAVARIGLLFT